MAYPKFSKKKHNQFFAKTIDCGIQASFSNAQGRKNYYIPKPEQPIEESPLATESFATDPEHYYDLMLRIKSLYN